MTQPAPPEHVESGGDTLMDEGASIEATTGIGAARIGRKRWLTAGVPVVSVVAFLVLWQIVGSHINPILLSTPTETVKAFWSLLTSGELGPAFGVAMSDLAIGYGLAIVVGIVGGILMGRNATFARVMNPFVNFFQATPLIAVVPLIVIWFGVGVEARVAVVFILGVWSILINTTTGVQETPSSLLDVARVYKFTPIQIVWRVALPNAVPSIFAGLRIGLGKALIGMVIAQMEVSIVGLGGIIVNYGNAFKTAYLLAGVFTASIVGVVAAVALEMLRRWWFPWTHRDHLAV